MGLLALASCVTLLTGCESDALFGLGGVWNSVADYGSGLLEKFGLKKGEEKKEKEEEQKQQEEQQPQPEPEPVKEVKISLHDMPEALLIGQELDLDEHVTVENSDEAFTVVLSEESAEAASLEGHKISVLDEGKVAFTVSVADKSASASLSSFAVDRYILMTHFGDLGQSYSAFSLNSSYQMDGYLSRGDNFFVCDTWTEDANKNLLPGGMIRFDEEADEAYPFILSFDDQGVDSIDVDAEIYPGYYLDEFYSLAFKFDFSKLERFVEVEEDPVDPENPEIYEWYSLFGEDATDFCYDYFLDDGVYLYLDDTYTDYDYFEFVRVDFSPVQIDDEGNLGLLAEVFVDFTVPEPEDPTDTGDSQSGLAREGEETAAAEPNYELAAMYLVTDQDEALFDSVGSVAGKPEEAPEGLNIAGQLSLSQRFGLVRTYAESSQYGASASLSYGWLYEGYPVSLTTEDWEDLGLDGYIFKNFPQGGLYETMGQELIADFTYSSQTGATLTSGVASNTENETTKFYDVEYDADKDEYSTFERTDVESIYDSEQFHLGEFAKESFWAKDLFYGAQPEYTEVTDDEGNTTQKFAGYTLYMNIHRQNKVFDEIVKFSDALSYFVDKDLYDVFEGELYVAASGTQAVFTFVCDYVSGLTGGLLNLVYYVQLSINIPDKYSSFNSAFYSQLTFGAEAQD